MSDACGPNPLVITIFNVTDITSPGFPDAYPNGINCTWLIAAETGKRVLLSVKGHEIEQKYLSIDFDIG